MADLKEFFKSLLSKDSAKVQPGVLDEMEEKLSNYDEEQAKFLACTSLLMSRIAFADTEISRAERTKMSDILTEKMGMDETQAETITNLALERASAIHCEDHLILRHLRECDRDTKENLMRSLFALASEDDISNTENKELRLVASGLGLSHEEFVTLRSEFREHLSFLKGS